MHGDIQAAIDAAPRLVDGFDNVDPQAQAIVVDMIYNLGERGFRGFSNTRTAFAGRDYNTAADEMMDSRWYNQVGRRSRHHVDAIRPERRLI